MSNYSCLFDEFDKNANFSEEIRKRFNLDEKEFEKIKKARDSHELIKLVKKMDSGFYRECPFLSIADELLQSLKEDLIEELVVATSHAKGRYTENGDPRKIEKFQKTFGLFPNCKLECIELVKDGKGEARPFRWDWTKENYPEFDIFIDDNQKVIEKARKNFSDRALFVLPKYKTNEKTEGIHVEVAVSDLKDEDFAQAAEEYKAKKEQEKLASRQVKQNQETSQAKQSFWKQPYLYIAFMSGVGVSLLGMEFII